METKMSKAVINIGYDNYVMDTKDAIAILELINSAEIYKEKYRSTADGGSTYHIYPQSYDSSKTIRIISDDLYRMSKLAGEPEEN
jgi:hypothetical protein